ncbi:hypothetical protein [Rhodopirellula baltica]|uniref:Cytochrome c domain-containing protein n=1 Tax=Rhodopirellula baltica (strain DSM 10527 / NCIMB 13988 / SH1) TaxID=243090 RepID=Q7UT56_RHOBA|nr:hypothetical protein [Rhodopirellula baltica]CAD73583.1 hypothetical protein-transmembrane region and signal peptide prediction [Rhodopirellula baltica SH 1]
MNRVILQSFGLAIAAIMSGMFSCPCNAQNQLKVEGKTSYIIRLRPSTNRLSGWLSKAIKGGEPPVNLELKHSGPYDMHLLFLNEDGETVSSWSSNGPVDFANIDLSKSFDLSMLQMMFMVTGSSGQPEPFAVSAWHMRNGNVLFHSPIGLLIRTGLAFEFDKEDLDTHITVKGENDAIDLHFSGTLDALEISVNGAQMKVDNLWLAHDDIRKNDLVCSGTYQFKNESGEFLIHRKIGFPGCKFFVNFKAKNAEWTSLVYSANYVASAPDTSFVAEELRAAVQRLETLIGVEQKRLAKQSDLIESQVKQLGFAQSRMADTTDELWLKLNNPEVHSVLTKCMKCHREGKHGPSFAGHEAWLPAMAEPTMKEMSNLAKLTEEQRAALDRFIRNVAAAE